MRYSAKAGVGRNHKLGSFLFTGGAELFGSVNNEFTHEVKDYEYLNDSLQNYAVDIKKDPPAYQAGLMLFTGVRHKVWKNFGVGIESGLALVYNWQKGIPQHDVNTYDAKGTLIKNEVYEEEVDYKGFGTTWNRFSFVLTYQF